MKQEELVAFVEALARAEKAAQTEIDRAEADARASLEAHGRVLARTYAERLEALARDWDEKEERAIQRAEKEIEALRRKTDDRIAEMRERHAHILDSLVRWGVDRVTGDA